MSTKQTWLDAGLSLLSTEGITALRIDRLATALGLSKGSFYHHFAGISGYRLDLLDHYEARCTTRHIDLVEAQADTSPREKLDRLREAVLTDDQWGPELDIAMRAWASQDDDARAAQERIDRTRLDYLQSLWEQTSGDVEEAVAVSRMIYLLLIGSHHVIPALPVEHLDQLYARVLRQADEAAR